MIVFQRQHILPTTLDDFVAWNDQLAALVQAGVPLDFGLGASGADLTESLKRINAAVARRVSRGESLSPEKLPMVVFTADELLG